MFGSPKYAVGGIAGAIIVWLSPKFLKQLSLTMNSFLAPQMFGTGGFKASLVALPMTVALLSIVFSKLPSKSSVPSNGWTRTAAIGVIAISVGLVHSLLIALMPVIATIVVSPVARVFCLVALLCGIPTLSLLFPKHRHLAAVERLKLTVPSMVLILWQAATLLVCGLIPTFVIYVFQATLIAARGGE